MIKISYLTNQSKIYAVVGDPISHSLSPLIHNILYGHLQLDRCYIALRIPPNDFNNAMMILRLNLNGFNVTIPHKESIIPLLDDIEDKCKIYGAVNTVKLEEGRLKGYNTDGYGFVKSLEAKGISLAGRKVLILGAGGAARGIAYESILMGARITIATRSIDKANSLKKDLELNTGALNIKTIKTEDLEEEYYCIINTTPLGMMSLDDELPVSESVIQKTQILYDLIYNPSRTKFLKVGEKYGCKIINGFSMLFFQAIRAQEIWLERSIERNIVDLVYQDVIRYIGDDAYNEGR